MRIHLQIISDWQQKCYKNYHWWDLQMANSKIGKRCTWHPNSMEFSKVSDWRKWKSNRQPITLDFYRNFDSEILVCWELIEGMNSKILLKNGLLSMINIFINKLKKQCTYCTKFSNYIYLINIFANFYLSCSNLYIFVQWIILNYTLWISLGVLIKQNEKNRIYI